jgi:hypothetical protein
VSTQERALAAVGEFLDAQGVPYMLIGGQANAVWGEPRATLDVDVTIWVEPTRVAALIVAAGAAFRCMVPEPEAFVSSTRVLPLQTDDGVRIDMIFGMLPFEEEAISRARSLRVGGATLRVCAPEDLILMKIISDRERDLGDARGIAIRQIAVLDLPYLEPRIRELAALLDRSEILERWEAIKRAAT